jgi:hypothetical protein
MKNSQSRTQPEANRKGHLIGRRANGSDRTAIWAGGQQQGVGAQHGLGARYGGCSDAVDALPERGYTIHVGSLPELRGLL